MENKEEPVFTPDTKVEDQVKLVAMHNQAQNYNIEALYNRVEELEREVKSFKELPVPETELEEEEPEIPNNKFGFFKYLLSIFLISPVVLERCKSDRSQIVYLVISFGMRIGLLWSLPLIVRAFLGN